MTRLLFKVRMLRTSWTGPSLASTLLILGSLAGDSTDQSAQQEGYHQRKGEHFRSKMEHILYTSIRYL